MRCRSWLAIAFLAISLFTLWHEKDMRYYQVRKGGTGTIYTFNSTIPMHITFYRHVDGSDCFVFKDSMFWGVYKYIYERT